MIPNQINSLYISVPTQILWTLSCPGFQNSQYLKALNIRYSKYKAEYNFKELFQAIKQKYTD